MDFKAGFAVIDKAVLIFGQNYSFTIFLSYIFIAILPFMITGLAG